MKKSTEEARSIARHINGWLNEYAPSHKSSSSHTIKSYAQALSLYIGFLEIEKKIEPSSLCLQRRKEISYRIISIQPAS